MVRHLFTPAEANRTLPLVRGIVGDILEKGVEFREGSALEKNEERRKKLRAIHSEIIRLMDELESIGCMYKDWSFHMGLVDFPSEIDGRPVLLCWRSDEEKVTWYHSIESGFAGRLPIPEELLEEVDPGREPAVPEPESGA